MGRVPQAYQLDIYMDIYSWVIVEAEIREDTGVLRHINWIATS